MTLISSFSTLDYLREVRGGGVVGLCGVTNGWWYIGLGLVACCLGNQVRVCVCVAGDGVPTVFVAVAGRSNGLGPVLSGHATYPVINCPPVAADWGPHEIWSSLRLPTGVSLIACTLGVSVLVFWLGEVYCVLCTLLTSPLYVVFAVCRAGLYNGADPRGCGSQCRANHRTDQSRCVGQVARPATQPTRCAQGG